MYVKYIVGQAVLCIISAYFFSSSNAACLNLTVVSNDLNNNATGVTLPDLPVEQFGNKYYYFGAILEGNYFQATQYCNYNGMSLLSIETKEENDFLWEKLQKLLGHGAYHFWTSGTILSDVFWVWLSTGKPAIYANWSPNQPDNAGGSESCLEVVYSYNNKALMWNDHECTAQKHIICETADVKCIPN